MRVGRILRAGRLTMQVEQAVVLIQATGVSTITTLLATVEDKPDRQLSTVARDAVFESRGVVERIIHVRTSGDLTENLKSEVPAHSPNPTPFPKRKAGPIGSAARLRIQMTPHMLPDQWVRASGRGRGPCSTLKADAAQRP